MDVEKVKSWEDVFELFLSAAYAEKKIDWLLEEIEKLKEEVALSTANATIATAKRCAEIAAGGCNKTRWHADKYISSAILKEFNLEGE